MVSQRKRSKNSVQFEVKQFQHTFSWKHPILYENLARLANKLNLSIQSLTLNPPCSHTFFSTLTMLLSPSSLAGFLQDFYHFQDARTSLRHALWFSSTLVDYRRASYHFTCHWTYSIHYTVTRDMIWSSSCTWRFNTRPTGPLNKLLCPIFIVSHGTWVDLNATLSALSRSRIVFLKIEAPYNVLESRSSPGLQHSVAGLHHSFGCNAVSHGFNTVLRDSNTVFLVCSKVLQPRTRQQKSSYNWTSLLQFLII